MTVGVWVDVAVSVHIADGFGVGRGVDDGCGVGVVKPGTALQPD